MRNALIFIVWCIAFLGETAGCASQKKIILQPADSVQIDELNTKIRRNDIEIDSLKHLVKYLQSNSNGHADSLAYRLQTQYFLVNKDDGLGLKDLAALAVSIIALLLSYILLRKENWDKNLDFISEIDKQFISDPTLWAVYDAEQGNYPLAKSGYNTETREERDGRLKAFCYYKLNNFESVFLSTYKWSKARKAWEAYMVHLIVESALFKDIATDASENYIYNPTYRKKLKKFLSLAGVIEPDYKIWLKTQTSPAKKKYYDTAKRVLQIK